MERVAALTDLRRGIFPVNFTENLGDIGDNLQYLLGCMVNTDENDRMTCEEVKSGVGRLIHMLRA
jgi:translation initiation factor 2-alpha kinase 3